MVLTTDASPLVHLTPDQVLTDKQRVQRLIAALSKGVFHDVDEKKATKILQGCQKICGGLTDTLSQVLQNRFFGGHTPYYWAIVNKSPSCHDPPLLKEIMSHGDSLTLETQKDIVKAFGMKFDSVLYEAMRPRLPMVHTFDACTESSLLSRNDTDIIMASTHHGPRPTATAQFEIPRIFSRLLANNSLCFRFYALGSLLSLTATISSDNPTDHPSWGFVLDEVKLPDAPAVGTADVYGTIEVRAMNGYRTTSKKYSNSRGGIAGLTPPALARVCIDEDLAHFLRNPFTDNERGQHSVMMTFNTY